MSLGPVGGVGPKDEKSWHFSQAQDWDGGEKPHSHTSAKQKEGSTVRQVLATGSVGNQGGRGKRRGVGWESVGGGMKVAALELRGRRFGKGIISPGGKRRGRKSVFRVEEKTRTK